MSPSNIAFYRTRASANIEQAPLEGGYRSEWWRPTLLNVAPRGLPLVPFGVWWGMHVFHVFSNHAYGILLIRKNGEVVHRSVIFPRYFRFPFMADDDLQIGDVWTSENHRGKGLAGFALREALRKEPQQGRAYWYITEDTNVASVRVAEKAGFERVGEGVRTARFGLRPLGAFVMLREPARKQEQQTA
jgi:RimJ/RimL family protein N-acetyltransferase